MERLLIFPVNLPSYTIVIIAKVLRITIFVQIMLIFNFLSIMIPAVKFGVQSQISQIINKIALSVYNHDDAKTNEELEFSETPLLFHQLFI